MSKEPMTDERLKEIEERRKDGMRWCYQGAYEFWDAAISELIACVHKLREERRWIPVGERLPDKEPDSYYSKKIKIYIASGRRVEGYYNYKWNRWEAEDWVYSPSEITHWREIPAPPSEEVEDGTRRNA